MLLFAEVSSNVNEAAGQVTAATQDIVAWGQHLQDSMVQSISAVASKVAGFVPNLLGMTLILVVGYFVSKLLQRTAALILRRVQFDVASEKTGLRETMQTVGIQLSASDVVGKLVFWLFMLTFLISAADVLGLQNVSRTINSFVAYLPNVIGATLIVVVGLMLANFVRTLVEGGASRIGLEYGKPLSKLVYGVLLVVIGSLAIGQLQLETALLNRVIEIVLVAMGAALAISVGLGSRDVARHIISGVYAREVLRHGAKISIGDEDGVVERVGAVNTDIKTANGIVLHIPNGQLFETMVREG